MARQRPGIPRCTCGEIEISRKFSATPESVKLKSTTASQDREVQDVATPQTGPTIVHPGRIRRTLERPSSTAQYLRASRNTETLLAIPNSASSREYDLMASSDEQLHTKYGLPRSQPRAVLNINFSRRLASHDNAAATCLQSRRIGYGPASDAFLIILTLDSSR